MADPKITIKKSKRVAPVLPERLRGPVKPEMLGRDAVKPEQVMDRRPERSVPIDDYDYKRDRFTSDQPYNPADYEYGGPGTMLLDGIKSIPSSGLRLAESLFGFGGDQTEGRYGLAELINRKLGKYSGMDLNKGIKQAEATTTSLPTTEDIAENVTDPVLNAVGAKDAMRYQPKTPVGMGVDQIVQFGDLPVAGPMAALGKASRFARRLR